MAALAMQGEYDEELLTRDYQRYRALALQLRQKQRPLELERNESPANEGVCG